MTGEIKLIVDVGNRKTDHVITQSPYTRLGPHKAQCGNISATEVTTVYKRYKQPNDVHNVRGAGLLTRP